MTAVSSPRSAWRSSGSGRAARRDGRARRRGRRLRPRRAFRRGRRRTAVPSPPTWPVSFRACSADWALRTFRRRVRGDRELDLLRARHHRRAARSASRRRPPLHGILFLVVALSYAEGTAELARPEARRRSSGARSTTSPGSSPAGRCSWTTSSSPLSPRSSCRTTSGAQLGVEALARARGTRSSRSGRSVSSAARASRGGSGAYAAGIGVTAIGLFTQVLLVVLGLALLWSPEALTGGVSLGESPTWHAIAFALPLAMLAYTGLETVANLAEETRPPGRAAAAKPLRRRSAPSSSCTSGSPSSASWLFRRRPGRPSSGTEWVGAPFDGDRISALDEHLPTWLHYAAPRLRRPLGSAGSCCSPRGDVHLRLRSRLAYSLGEHGQLPRAFGRLHRRTLVSPEAGGSRRSSSPRRSSC